MELIESATRDEQLAVRTPEETYILSGVFSPAKMISLIQGIIEYSKRRGFVRFRGAGELNWAMTGMPGSENLFNYEASLNKFLKERPDVSILCLYDRRVFPPRIIEEAQLVHAASTVRGRV